MRTHSQTAREKANLENREYVYIRDCHSFVEKVAARPAHQYDCYPYRTSLKLGLVMPGPVTGVVMLTDLGKWYIDETFRRTLRGHEEYAALMLAIDNQVSAAEFAVTDWLQERNKPEWEAWALLTECGRQPVRDVVRSGWHRWRSGYDSVASPPAAVLAVIPYRWGSESLGAWTGTFQSRSQAYESAVDSYTRTKLKVRQRWAKELRELVMSHG